MDRLSARRTRRARGHRRSVAPAREAVRRRRHGPRAGARRRRARTTPLPAVAHPHRAIRRVGERRLDRRSRSNDGGPGAGGREPSRVRRAAAGRGVEGRRASSLPRASPTSTRDGAGLRIETAGGQRLGAGTLVGADGANSLVRRRVATAVPPRPAVDRHRLLRARRHRRRDRDRVHRRSARLHLVVPAARSPGDRHLRAGRRGRDRGGAARAHRAVDRGDRHRGGCAARAVLVADPVALGADFETLALAGPGWMLVGDAAGLVDPITREGIFFALQSASVRRRALASHSSDAAAARARLPRARARRRSPPELAARRALQGAASSGPRFIDC